MVLSKFESHLSKEIGKSHAEGSYLYVLYIGTLYAGIKQLHVPRR